MFAELFAEPLTELCTECFYKSLICFCYLFTIDLC